MKITDASFKRGLEKFSKTLAKKRCTKCKNGYLEAELKHFGSTKEGFEELLKSPKALNRVYCDCADGFFARIVQREVGKQFIAGYQVGKSHTTL